jgi:hypothetical protein
MNIRMANFGGYIPSHIWDLTRRLNGPSGKIIIGAATDAKDQRAMRISKIAWKFTPSEKLRDDEVEMYCDANVVCHEIPTLVYWFGMTRYDIALVPHRWTNAQVHADQLISYAGYNKVTEQIKQLASSIPPCMPHYHSGIMIYRKNAKVLDLFKRTLGLIKTAGITRDETALNRAIIDSKVLVMPIPRNNMAVLSVAKTNQARGME